MSFTESIKNAVATVGSAAAYADKDTDEASESTETEPVSVDTAETAADDAADVPVKDSALGKATKAVSEGAQQAWELTAKAQHRANTEASKSFADRVEDKLEDTKREVIETGRPISDDAKRSMLAGQVARNMKHKSEAEEHAEHVAEGPFEIARTTAEADHLFHFTHGGTHGAIAGGSNALSYASIGVNAETVLEDAFNGHGLSVDSLKPTADIGVTVASLAAESNLLVQAFSFGYSIGCVIDHYTGLSNVGANIAERRIARTSNMGFLSDRAEEMNRTADARIEHGTWTDDDLARSKTIVREARERGILDEDGNVVREELFSQYPEPLKNPEALNRVSDGIERAAALQKAAGTW